MNVYLHFFVYLCNYVNKIRNHKKKVYSAFYFFYFYFT